MIEKDAPRNAPSATQVFWDLAYRKGREAGLKEALHRDLVAWATFFVLSMLVGFVLGWILGT